MQHSPRAGGGSKKVQLDTPEITINAAEKKVNWEKIDHTSEYLVQINDSVPIEVGTVLTYDLTDLTYGTYQIKVRAMGTGRYINSDWSDAKEYKYLQQLSAPELAMHQSGTQIIWLPITSADGYSVRVNGGTPVKVAESVYSLSGLTETGVYEIEVRANGNNTNNADSDWSESFEYIVKEELIAPLHLDLDIDGKIATWDAVIGATSYIVRVNKLEIGQSEPIGHSDYANIDNTEFDLSIIEVDLGAGNYTVQVMAVGNGKEYLDSEFSNALTYSLTEGEDDEFVAQAQLSLPVPELTISDGKIEWREVPHATGYKVEIDGVADDASTAEYSLAELIEPKVYEIRVKALGDGDDYVDSDWSKITKYIVTVRLDAPVLNVNNGAKIVSWASVNNANSYVIKIKDSSGNEVKTGTNATSFSLQSLAAGTYTVQVMAIGDSGQDIVYLDSEWSNEAAYTQTEELAQPTGLTLEDGVFTWNSVDGAIGYEVYVDSYKVKTVGAQESRAYTLEGTDLATGRHTIEVLALGNSNPYTNSPKAKFDYTKTEQLAKPEISVDMDLEKVTWNAVLNASGYKIYVNNDLFVSLCCKWRKSLFVLR